MALFKGSDFLSKVKETATSAANKVKETAENAKAAYEQKKAEEEQHRIEMEAEAVRYAGEIKEAIFNYQNQKGFFDGIDLSELMTFTKDFYDKIFMPANSISKSKVTMHPNIEEKQLQKFANANPEYDFSETPLFFLKAEGKQSFVLTDKALYYVIALSADPKFFAKGRIPCEQISKFTIEQRDSCFAFMCDEYTLATFSVDKSTSEDFITLDNYFKAILNHDFTITDEEVDALIQTKIGTKVYNEVKKYLVYDDELMVYFAWGVDSLSAKDYIVCTNKQIIMMNREMLGATANVKQFYYEDITSASTVQNSNSNDLTVALLETAITAATKTCDLVISTSGSSLRINTLFKIEAERIVAVYHQYRKLAKTASSQPQVIVQQQTVDPVEQLKKLAEMRDLGILSEDEFNAKKADLLSKI